jgi:DNA (cytosine-5)-methyltransferase 1
MKTMHLFAGGGGGLLADLILGHTPIVAVEWDKYACEILRARRDDGWFEGLHVWEGDVRLFNPSEYEGRVDCIHAGFPCQDLSQAGKQAGLGEGTRSGLYREVLRIAGLVRPKYIFMENVSAILSNGLGVVLADLATMGYDARWCCIRASDVGAPHQRDRWWLKATMGDTDNDGHLTAKIRTSVNERGNNSEARQKQSSEFKGPSKQYAELAHADSIGHLHCEAKINPAERGEYAQRDTSTSCDDVANANSAQRKRERKPVRVRQEHADIGEYSWWEVESNVGRVAHGVADWAHRLKSLGNGQVPLQAALAWRLLS